MSQENATGHLLDVLDKHCVERSCKMGEKVTQKPEATQAPENIKTRSNWLQFGALMKVQFSKHLATLMAAFY